MNKLTAQDFREIRQWVYRNARPLELALWQYHFERGGKETVLDALCAYRNDDGGFGHALEPDNWNPASTPYVTSHAIGVLNDIALTSAQHPVIQGILGYLESGDSHFANNRWPFTISSNDDYPHAPWWNYGEDNNEQNGFFPTLTLVVFILRYSDKASSLYKRALTIIDAMLVKAKNTAEMDGHELHCYCNFIDAIADAGLTHLFDYAVLVDSLREKVDAAIERDTSKWKVYTMMPSMFMHSPSGAFYKGNEDIMAREIDHMLASRKPGGVWDVTWQWGKYNDEFAVSANWWRSCISINNIRLLKRFGRADI